MNIETIKKILSWCCKFDHNCKYSHAPMFYNGILCATDKYILVKIPHSENPGFQLMDDDLYKKFSAPINTEITQEIRIPIDKLKLVLENLESYSHEVYSSPPIQCTECDGTGSVEWEYKNFNEEFDCPVCEGRSETKGRKFKTGLICYPTSFSVKFSSYIYSSYYVGILLQIAELLNQNEILILDEKGEQGRAHFKIGELDITLMSLMGSANPDFIIE